MEMPMPGSDELTRATITPRVTPSLTVIEAVGSLRTPSPCRYELSEEVARGSMGVVFRAVDTGLGREVAVKVLQAKFGPGSSAAPLRRRAPHHRANTAPQHPRGA